MPKAKLTARTVESAKPAAPGQRYELFDTALPGFGLRVTDSGRKTWILFYRCGGLQRRLTLGHFPALSLAAAREAAQAALHQVERGIDPAVAKAASRERSETGHRRGSFGELAALYIERECPGLRRGGEIKSIIENELKAWNGRPALELRRKDLTTLLDPIVAEGKVQKAHKVREIAIRVINWAIDRGDLELNMLTSPSRGRKRAGILRRAKRDRVLSPAELRAAWLACDAAGSIVGSFAKLLMLTGQRRDEVAGMRWSELDFDRAADEWAAGGVWTIPADRYKTGIAHVVPLSAPAREILRAMWIRPECCCDEFVFSSEPGTRLKGFSWARKRLPTGEGGNAWTFHDLRRTLRTGLASLGVNADVAERVLGHVIGGVEGVYDRYAYLPEKRDALDRWADHVIALTQRPHLATA